MIDNTELNLLPCPFCGCSAIYTAPSNDDPVWHRVECADCPAELSELMEEDAIAGWNRRAQPLPAVPDVDIAALKTKAFESELELSMWILDFCVALEIPHTRKRSKILDVIDELKQRFPAVPDVDLEEAWQAMDPGYEGEDSLARFIAGDKRRIANLERQLEQAQGRITTLERENDALKDKVTANGIRFGASKVTLQSKNADLEQRIATLQAALKPFIKVARELDELAAHTHIAQFTVYAQINTVLGPDVAEWRKLAELGVEQTVETK